MLSMVFVIAAVSTAAAPAGIESPQNATSCIPPETLVNRTVVPGSIVSTLGSNAATLLPLPVILTSTTGPAAAGVAAGWLAGLCLAATGEGDERDNGREQSEAHLRMTSGNVGWWACERIHNIEGARENGRPGSPGISW